MEIDVCTAPLSEKAIETKKIVTKNVKIMLDNRKGVCYIIIKQGAKPRTNLKKNGVKTMKEYNLNRIERHYMIEVMLDFVNKHGREMTKEEHDKAVEKMRAKRAL